MARERAATEGARLGQHHPSVPGSLQPLACIVEQGGAGWHLRPTTLAGVPGMRNAPLSHEVGRTRDGRTHRRQGPDHRLRSDEGWW